VPNITFLVPVRDGAAYLFNSIKNISATASSNDEILIVNDYSTDDTAKIIKQFSQNDPRVQLIHNKEPGLVGALNLGVKESKNTWIARCDVDDKYSLDRIAIQSKEIRTNSAAIFSDYTFFSNSIENLGRIPSAILKEAVSISLALSQRTAHPSVLMNKNAVKEAGGYISKDFPAEDLSLWLRLSRIGDLTSVENNLLFYRLNSNSISFQKRKEIIAKKNELLRKVGINPKDYLFVLDNISEILHKYEGMELGNQRKLLLIKDVLTIKLNLANFGLSSVKTNSHRLKIVSSLLKIQTVKDVYELNTFKRKRNRVRGLTE
jgi:glycosyltransferase involved in cell wall biosynthesis